MLKQKIAMASTIAAFLFAAAIASNAYAALPEYTMQPYSPGVYYTGIHLNDMDGDGRPEVLIGNRNTSSVEIWKYNPATEMLERIDTIGFPYHIHDIKAADLDGDGDKDLVVGLRFYGLYVAINQGGSWSKAQIDGTYSWQVLLGDFNRDGKLDIFDGVDWQLAKIFYGDGSGGFALGPSPPQPFTGYNAPLGFNVADMNNDGRPDLIGPTVELPGGCYLRAYLNTDVGGVVNWTSVGPAATSADAGCPSSVLNPSAGDLDGNGLIDQVAMSPTGDVLIFEGGTSGGNLVWTQRTLATLSTGAASIGVADLNGDGHLDVHVEGSNLFNGINVYLGDGTGNFTPESLPLDHGVGGFNAFQTGDINGDGLTDIVTVRNVAGSPSGFEVLYQVGNTPMGTNVRVNPDVTVSVTFSQVTHAGNTTAKIDTTNPGSEKSGFKFLGTYYDIKTTAAYTGPVSVCLSYDDAGIPGNREQRLKIFHWNGTDWINATSSLDTTNNIICGSVASFSWFGAAYELYVYSGVLQPINADGSSIFRLGSTISVKFQLWDAEGNFVTNAQARIYLTKISDNIAGNETEAVSTSAATEGNLFRYDSVANQYIFNLSTKSLSTGTWQLRILLDDGTSKYVTISLR